jgi:XRE family aerobic/anaerobic benzoate catabolism transcriptional regulator
VSGARRRSGLLLRECFTVWLRASPEEHYAPRQVAKATLRPDVGNPRSDGGSQAHSSPGREAFYAKA